MRRFTPHILATTPNYIIRKAADGMMAQRLCTMETLVADTALLQATDRRDIVYVMLALAKDFVLLMKIPVSYEMPSAKSAKTSLTMLSIHSRL